jgi:hypothetical protein
MSGVLENILSRLRRVRRSGKGWVALCPAHDDHHPSLSLTQNSSRTLVHCFAGCDLESICAAIDIRPDELREGASGANDDRAARKEYARAIWRASRSAANTVAERYLRGRGITIAPPPSIRFLPLRMHAEYGWPFPALAAGVQAPDGTFAAVSVTWLCADASGKAPVDPPRKIYGPYGGGCIRLAPAAEQLVLCEGIESGLSILQACTLPVWAGLSASNLSHVELPAIVREVIIAADADEPGEAAAQAAARRFLREEREIVRIARTGRQGTDFNDLISR